MTDEVHKVIMAWIYKRPITEQMSSQSCNHISRLLIASGFMLVVMWEMTCPCVSVNSSYPSARRVSKGNESLFQWEHFV